jgi:cytochrome-b5 reductase
MLRGPLLKLTAGALGIGVGAASIYQVKSPPAPAGATLDAKDFKPFKLVQVEKYNHNSKLYRLKVDGPPLPVASFVLARNIGADKKEVVRPYTPIEQKSNEITLLIKTYPNGNLSKYFDNLKVGDAVDLKGPIPKIPITANMKKEIVMLAGGTGVTPMLQVAKKILADPTDKTQVTLVFANNTEQDILLKEQLTDLQTKHENFSVRHVIWKPSDKWRGLSGTINADIIKRFVPAPSKDSLVIVCGPPPFMQAISGEKTKDYQQGDVTGLLKEHGYTSENVFKF